MDQPIQTVVCSCGKVQLEARGAPIVATVCHCSGCREAGHILESLPDAPRILDTEEGTPFVLYRKDWVNCVKGRELLREHRLSDATPTRRVVATCCNSFMFLDFTKGHWISLLRERIDDGHAGSNAPEVKRLSALFFAKLIFAWAKMGFRSPKIDYVQGRLKDG